jgi:AraC family transcriptional regulator of arabinose operon
MQRFGQIEYGFLPRNPPLATLEQQWPLAKAPQRRPQWIDLRSIRPVIHMAHRTTSPLALPDRLIYDHEIVFVLRGDGDLLSESGVQSFAPGDLLVILPFVPHRFTSRARQFEHIDVHFDLTSQSPTFPDLDAREPYQVLLDGGSTLRLRDHVANVDSRRGRLEQLVRNWAEDTHLGTLKAETALMEVVTSLLLVPHGEPPRPAAADERIERVLAEIERHLGEPPSVAVLARSANLGVSRFTRLFRERVGESPAAYVRRVRLNRAREILETTETPVKAIAFACGFRDAAHFSHAFFAMHGVWPTQQRQLATQARR